MAHTIFIRGIPEQPTVMDVRVRDKPGTVGTTTLFRIPVGATAQVSEIRLDPNGDNFQGQTYRWFSLTFADGRTGWVRDDLLDLQGDLRDFGYTIIPIRAYAFAAARNLPPPKEIVIPVSPLPPAPPPVAPSPSPAPAAPLPVSPPPAPPPPGTPTTDCIGTVRQDIQARVRAQPSMTAPLVTTLERGTRLKVVQVVLGIDGLSFRWAKVSAVGLDGFIREDLMTYSGDCSPLGLNTTPLSSPVVSSPVGSGSPTGLLPTPVKGSYVVTQEFGVGERSHKGVDLASNTAHPIIATGNAVVHQVVICTRCRPDAPNFRSQGLPPFDNNAINDPGWGFGFGNYVLLKYAWGDLPDQTRQALQGQGLANAFIYAVYAHLSRIDVQPGQPVSNGTQLGLLGNTGNSDGAHLHLELRASTDPNLRSIAGRVVINPRTMFSF